MIREANKCDCTRLAVLSIKVWLETHAIRGVKEEHAQYAYSKFSKAYFYELLLNPTYRLLVSEKDQAIQGYVLVNLGSSCEMASSGMEIEKLYVDDCFRNRGIGRGLLREVDRRYGSNYWLYTRVENSANGFYKQLGFKRVGLFSFEFAGNRINNYVYHSTNT